MWQVGVVGCGSWVGVVVGWGGGGLGWWWVGTDDVGDVKTRLMFEVWVVKRDGRQSASRKNDC